MATQAQRDFINLLAPYAQQAEATYGVPASVFIAQAIEETGWGKSKPGNNLFGIKVSSDWTGEKQLLWTTEYEGGVKKRVQAWFKKYDSLADSVADRIKLMGKKLYANVRNKDPYTAAYELQRAGYATNPNYAKNLIGHINSHNLTKFDLRTGGTQLPADKDFKFDPPSSSGSGSGGGSAQTPPISNAGFNLKDMLGGSALQQFWNSFQDFIILFLSVVGIILGFWLITKGEDKE